MSITADDVEAFIRQHAGHGPIRPSEIDRIVRILNAHGCSSGTARPHPPVGVPDLPNAGPRSESP
ncbi:hypothetical protein [Leekyejoonella antrihumi]|uniref:Uncharacterized protein n=1 Tax=Leekyejoonella antrihumi TaxID=1660198 RepID=A0A563DV27_9MICO|nr:hypothetical protein [Leekyejoonella antrihumi]TWP33821.1 hypothetical protein FGL98_19770 [Leekyejoonella antrihumi]